MPLSKQDVQRSIVNTRVSRKKALAYAAAAAVASTSSIAMADFTDSYAPENWTTSLSGGDVTNDGSIAILTGPDDGFQAELEYSIIVAGDGNIAFDWEYTNLLGDYGSYDYAGFLVNDNFTLLATNDDVAPGPLSASGSTSVSVSEGDRFAFVVASLDGQFGAGQLTIGNFDGAAIPEPSALGLLAAGTIGGLLASRRRKN